MESPEVCFSGDVIRRTALDDEKCFGVVRQLRWPNGVNCQQTFDVLTGTVFAGHHQPLWQWVAFLVRAAPMTTLDRCLYLMGLNLSNRQIAHELGLNEDDAQDMTRILRQGMVGRVHHTHARGHRRD